MREVRPLRAYAHVALGRQRSPQHENGPHMRPYLRAANVKDGALDLSDIKEMNFSPTEQSVFSLRPGDILVSEGSGSLRSVGASAVWSGEIAGVVCFQNTLLRLRPRAGTDPKFLAWWCRHAFADGLFASVAFGANIFHVSAERVRDLRLTYQPLSVQRAIADYLDTETARIDALIEKKRRMVELLVERKLQSERTVVADLVASLVPLRWFLTVGSGDGLPSEGVTPDGATPVVGGNGVMGYTDAVSRVLVPSIAVGRVGALCGNVHLVDPPAWITDNALWVRDFRGFVREFLAILLRAADLNTQADRTAQPLITGEAVKLLRVPRPPISEQHVVVSILDKQSRLIEEARQRLLRQIDKMSERRQAIITAAVTGELDIPGMAA
jgi:type I restriction enzyme, S subunit